MKSRSGEAESTETYVILRRCGWSASDTAREATTRSIAEAERMSDDVEWLRSYVLVERSGCAGTVCVFRASSPEAIRSHAIRANLPIDEIVKVADTLAAPEDASPVE